MTAPGDRQALAGAGEDADKNFTDAPVGQHVQPCLPVKKLRIELYQSPAGVWAPAEDLSDTKTSLWRLGILRGTHTAVTFVNGQGLGIHSNNPVNAIPNDPDIWVDTTPQNARRSIFFHGRGLPQQKTLSDIDKAGPHGAMFDPTFLQVWVRQWPNNRFIYVWLNGPSVCLNDADLARHGYRLTPFTHTVSDASTLTAAEEKSTAPLNPTKPNSPENVIKQVVDDVTNYRKQKGDASLVFNHLVISCHGFQREEPPGSKEFAPWLRLGHDWDFWKGKTRPTDNHGVAQVWNIGFSHYNIHLFGALKGMFRYIWVQGCEMAGASQAVPLMQEMATETGAIITAYLGSAPFLESAALRPKQDHIDFPHLSFPIHRDGTGSTINHDIFFRGARHAALPDLKESLYFNIVETRPAPASSGPRPPRAR